MSMEVFTGAYIFMLSVFVGFEVIRRVPVVLHTPLMSGANAIHGVVLVGGILVLAEAQSTLGIVLGVVAVVFGAMNVAGGFVVTDRMLHMFRKKSGGGKA